MVPSYYRHKEASLNDDQLQKLCLLIYSKAGKNYEIFCFKHDKVLQKAQSLLIIQQAAVLPTTAGK